MGSLPDAPEVVGTDVILLLKNGVVYQTTIDTLLSSREGVFEVDSTAGPSSVNINGYTSVFIVKTDNSANAVSISDSSGKTIEGLASYRSGLQNQYETVQLRLITGSNNWLVS